MKGILILISIISASIVCAGELSIHHRYAKTLPHLRTEARLKPDRFLLPSVDRHRDECLEGAHEVDLIQQIEVW